MFDLVIFASHIFRPNRLDEPSSSRWDNRSDSAWSRSPEHSSDRSSKRSSPRRQQKKEKKKAKHKKKAKKRKHSRKKRSKIKARSDYRSEGERSLSSEKKSRGSHSSSCSSSNRYSSSARRRRHSSVSFRDSQSYSRSYTPSQSRSRGRTRSYSRSRSRSRSPSHSLSRSKSQSYSRTRSRSRSRSRSRYRSRSSSRRRRSFSRSPRKKKSSKSSSHNMVHGPDKPPDSTGTSFLRVPAAPPPESVPVIPLSDSPPPSRWKPGQKPWKPSYIHIQEIKAKVAANISFSGPTADGVADKTQPENEKTTKKSRHSTSRSSRSRSYSHSSSRSRSRSCSRSRSRDRYHSRSSSCSQSDSETSQRKQSSKTDPLDKNWKEPHHSLGKTKHLDKYSSCTGSQDAPSGSEKRSPDVSVSKRTRSSRESFKNTSDWDSDSDKMSQSNSVTKVKKEKHALQAGEGLEKKAPALTGWNSGSDENINAPRPLVISEKEEGEASSDSDYGIYRKTSEAVDTLEKKITAVVSSQSDQSPRKSPEPEKHKSKKKAKRKHKRKRSDNKSASHHGKEKGKRSKRKHQKLKETFHWQPPLEFGEEEEEDESKREKHSPTKAVKEKPAVAASKAKGPHLTPSNKNNPSNHRHQRTKHADVHVQPSSRNANIASGREQDCLDDMDICTPEHVTEIVAPSVFQDSCHKTTEPTLNSTSKPSGSPSQDQSSLSPTASASGQVDDATAVGAADAVLGFKWRPLKGMSAGQNVNVSFAALKNCQVLESQSSSTQGVRMEIKSKSRIRPGSLFDEVRKTARLNQRPRNQESSSEERSPSVGNAKTASCPRSPKESRSVSRKSRSGSSQRSSSRGWSHSYSRSRSRSRSSSYSSR